MQKSYSGRNRAEAIRRIFTEGVKDFAREKGCPLGQALSELAAENRDLWEEYSADVLPVQGSVSAERASSTLAAEVNAFAREHQVSLSQALQEVARANSALWERYRDQITILP
jgi:transposase-like protein